MVVLMALFATGSSGQAVFRCTGTDGKTTYQEAPCPKSSSEQKVDATPANPAYDPAQRERLLKEGAEAGKRLEARTAKEDEERSRRQAQREAEEKREREAQAREEAREYAPTIYNWPPGQRPPWGGFTPKPPGPRPQPLTPGK